MQELSIGGDIIDSRGYAYLVVLLRDTRCRYFRLSQITIPRGFFGVFHNVLVDSKLVSFKILSFYDTEMHNECNSQPITDPSSRLICILRHPSFCRHESKWGKVCKNSANLADPRQVLVWLLLPDIQLVACW